MNIKSLLIFLSATLFLASCFDTPNLPDTPHIDYKDVLFQIVGDNSTPDSLIIVIDFEDGDGDLGLDASESSAPYNLKNYFNNKTGQVLSGVIDVADLLTFSDRATIDTLPPFEAPYTCINWDTSPSLFFPDGSQLDDTAYFQFNPRHFNIFVDYFVKESGEFRQFDWRLEIDCSINYDGRFPKLNNTDNDKVLEGTIRYGMVSSGFESLFGNKTMKLRIQILDRAGHESNMVETPEFTLDDIRVN